MTLQYISHCGKTWMVGLNGKATDKQPSACSGSLGGVPYVGFENEQIAAAPGVEEEMPCKVCGKMVEVKTAVGQPMNAENRKSS